jgi:hypothetical protein
MALGIPEKVVKKLLLSPATEAECLSKSDFDSHMTMVRHHVRFSSEPAGEYYFRQMMKEVHILSHRYGFKIS